MRILYALALAVSGTAAIAGNSHAPAAPEPALTTSQQILLTAHNDERLAKNLPKLSWSVKMQADAQIWADHLASQNRMFHSTYEERDKAGENLWSGTTGRFTPQHMMEAFLTERQHFQAGKFPDVTATNNWQDVGHYTQIIWPDTQEVGCATAKSATFDYLVCRYWPAGNRAGTQLD